MDLHHPADCLSPRDELVPAIGFVGSSGSGKTTLISHILPLLTARGLRVGVMKHAHHGFDLDRPGKDSYIARAAGATQVLVASGRRWALLTDHARHLPEPAFHELRHRFLPAEVDLILCEGFATESYPKIEVYRPDQGQPPRCWPSDRDVMAVASDVQLAVEPPCCWLDLNDSAAIASFVYHTLPLLPSAHV